MMDQGLDLEGMTEDTDNITDWCLSEFQTRYEDPSITKDDIWEYLYGVMHAPDWRKRYRNDLLAICPGCLWPLILRLFGRRGGN